MVGFAEALVKVVMQLFNRCALVLTDRRLILMTPSWPRGYKAEGSFPRSSCTILKTKRRFDGSTLIVISHGAGVTCLYLSRPWSSQAEVIIGALTPETSAQVPPPPRGTPSDEHPGPPVVVVAAPSDQGDRSGAPASPFPASDDFIGPDGPHQPVAFGYPPTLDRDEDGN